MYSFMAAYLTISFVKGGGGGVVKGSSFSLDTRNRLTRIHGKGISVDLEVVELMASGGSLKFSPTHIEYVRRAISTYLCVILICVSSDEREHAVD
jgi:hypothetical protein